MKIPRIKDAWAVAGLGGWYVDDKRAILDGAKKDGYLYSGQPQTAGFRAIREPGEALLVTLQGEDGSLGEGDCVSVTYAGDAGRQAPFHAAEQLKILQDRIFPQLLGQVWAGFRSASTDLQVMAAEANLHPALVYGLSQALLGLVASAANRTITEVICEEYGLPLPKLPTPVGIQTGDDRYLGADKAIVKRADALPHGLFKTADDFGKNGSALVEYLGWLKKRINTLGSEGYHPTIHFDVYGGIGRLFEHDPERMAAFIRLLEKLANPYPLQIESPVEMPTQPEQVVVLARLNSILRQSGSNVHIIVDEWCNTLQDIHTFASEKACSMIQIKMPDMGSIADSIEAVLLCKQYGLGAYLGGSCNETALSAQIAAQVALATGASQILARPGMGVDEGLMVMRNEMARTLARLEHCGFQL